MGEEATLGWEGICEGEAMPGLDQRWDGEAAPHSARRFWERSSARDPLHLPPVSPPQSQCCLPPCSGLRPQVLCDWVLSPAPKQLPATLWSPGLTLKLHCQPRAGTQECLELPLAAAERLSRAGRQQETWTEEFPLGANLFPTGAHM